MVAGAAPFLGSLPVDSELVTLLDAAESAEALDPESTSFGILDRYKKTRTYPLFQEIVRKAMANVATSTPVSG